MNYFELFSMPVSFKPDKSLLKQKFYEVSRKFHPDFFGNATEAEQAEALETSSLINTAYKILTDDDATIKYLLQQKQLLEDDEKYNLPQDFLMDMLDINDAADEAKSSDNAASIKNIQSSILNLQSQIYAPVVQIIQNYKDGITTEEELLQVKDYYFKKKYLTRILDGL